MIMEWAIGKGYDRYRDDTGKLLMPGEKISWDQHIHAVGEEIPTGSELAFWFYPKGQEPKKRSYLVGFSGIDRTKMLDIPPNSIARTDGFTVLKDGPAVWAELMALARRFDFGGKQVHDANIVATMLAHGETRLLTFNQADFRRFAGLIEVLPP